tara:strand:+ start:619 stop:1005 length:387 start_codon:yes stop_codon:yes gene_type:complete
MLALQRPEQRQRAIWAMLKASAPEPLAEVDWPFGNEITRDELFALGATRMMAGMFLSQTSEHFYSDRPDRQRTWPELAAMTEVQFLKNRNLGLKGITLARLGLSKRGLKFVGERLSNRRVVCAYMYNG